MFGIVEDLDTELLIEVREDWRNCGLLFDFPLNTTRPTSLISSTWHHFVQHSSKTGHFAVSFEQPVGNWALSSLCCSNSVANILALHLYLFGGCDCHMLVCHHVCPVKKCNVFRGFVTISIHVWVSEYWDCMGTNMRGLAQPVYHCSLVVEWCEWCSLVVEDNRVLWESI